MDVEITKMSQNGQVVIPSEIRKDAKIKPGTKFLIFNNDGQILLKPIDKEALMKDMELARNIEKGEEDIRKGRFVEADTRMSVKEIDDLLMGDDK